MSVDINKYRNTDQICDSINHKLVECMEATKPIGEMLTNAITLLLMSISLIALSLVDQKPTSIDVMGFSITTTHWLYLAIPITAMVIYLLINLRYSGSLTLQQWKLVTQPRLVSTSISIKLIINDSYQMIDQIKSSIDTLDFDDFLEFEPKLLPDMKGRPSSEVRKLLQFQVDEKLKDSKASSFFKIFSKTIWTHSQVLIITNLLANNASDKRVNKKSIHDQELSATLVKLGKSLDSEGKYNHLAYMSHLEELLEQYKKMNKVIVTLGNELDRLIKRSNRLSILNFWFPIGFASLSLLIMLFQASKVIYFLYD